MKRVLLVGLLSAGALLAIVVAAANAADPGNPSGLDRHWLMAAIQGDRFEVAGGKLALRKSQNAAVRKLAARLVKDHSQSLKESVALARRLGVDVPKAPSPSQQWELRAVAALRGSAFDRMYADLEVQDHRQDIEEAEEEVAMGTNPDVAGSAKEEIPVLKQHLALAKAARRKS